MTKLINHFLGIPVLSLSLLLAIVSVSLAADRSDYTQWAQAKIGKSVIRSVPPEYRKKVRYRKIVVRLGKRKDGKLQGLLGVRTPRIRGLEVFFPELERGGKAVITGLEVGSPADRAGLIVGNMIHSINDEEVKTAREVYNTLEKIQPGHLAKLQIIDLGRSARELAQLMKRRYEKSEEAGAAAYVLGQLNWYGEFDPQAVSANLGRHANLHYRMRRERRLGILWFNKAVEKHHPAAPYWLATIFDQNFAESWREKSGLYLLHSMRIGGDKAKSNILKRVWSADTRKAAQRVLKEAGLYDGPIDGAWGSKASQKALDRLVAGEGTLPPMPTKEVARLFSVE